jgi:ubiquitin C-terminal hydrolase
MSGIANTGNSCYFNSILQCLARCHALHHFLVDNVRDYARRIQGQTPLILHLRDIFQALVSEQGCTVRSVPFRKALKARLPMHVGHQNDAHEFLVLFLDALHQDIRIELPNPKTPFQTRIAKDYSELADLFFGTTRRVVTCGHCNYRHANEELFSALPVVAKNAPLETCIRDEYVSNELAPHDWKCSECGQVGQNSRIESSFGRMPYVLCVLLKRFEQGLRGQARKDNTDVQIPHVLFDRQYRLSAVTHHVGGMQSGHYVASFLDRNTKQWMAVDDEAVHVLEQIPTTFQHAYILFYEMCSTEA